MVATWASLLGVQPTLGPGNIIFMLMQSVAAQFVFLQALAAAINAVARAQTSTGADLDTFYAQFGFTRHAGVAASGPVVFSKFTAATSAVQIPAGTVVQTLGGALTYQVVADANQPTWNAALNAYVLQPGNSSLTATVQATQSGSAYNVAANQISQIASSVPGIDAVNNTVPFTNGQDTESDAAYRTRFVQFLNSLSKATRGAIESVVNGLPGVVDYNILENVNVSDVAQVGEFVVVIDDGTGSPPASLVTEVQNALEVTRGFTIEAQAIAVSVLTANIVLSVRVDPAYNQATVLGNVANAVAVAVNNTPIGGGIFGPDGSTILGAGWLYINVIEEAATAVAGVISVQPGQTKINTVAADLAVSGLQAARTNINDIAVGTY